MKNSGKRSLEGYKIFPYIAWILIGGFGLFVYNLANEIEHSTEELQNAQSQKLDFAQVETRLE